MITYKTLYWIVALIMFLWFNLGGNSFDDGIYGGRITKFLNSLVMFKKMKVTTFVSRFRVGVLLYLLSWIVWFLIF